MDKNDFYTLMDQVIVRENLEGNSAQTPKKIVQIMVRGSEGPRSRIGTRVRLRALRSPRSRGQTRLR